MPLSAAVSAAQMGGCFCFKGRFPFSLSVPSYIIPAGILENLLFLKDKVDEVELILFEGREASNLPSGRDILEFKSIANDSGLKFNVHLPQDLDIASGDPVFRKTSLDTMNRILELTEPLNPSSWILHVNKNPLVNPGAWRQDVHESLSGFRMARKRIAIENLDYDLCQISDIIISLGFSVCLDLGHAWMKLASPLELYNVFRDNVIAMHLHGVCEGKDHLPLSRLEPVKFEEAKKIIMGNGFKGSVSIEVFSKEHMVQSEEISSWLK